MKQVRTKPTTSPNLPAASSKVQLGYPLGLFELCHAHNSARGLKRKQGFLLRISFRRPQSGALQHRRLRTSDCQSKSGEFEWFILAFTEIITFGSAIEMGSVNLSKPQG